MARARIDHLIYGVPELERGMDEVAELLGERPAVGGRHPAYGTRNALVALGAETYLEILAPDPELEPPARGRLFGLGPDTEPRLVTWVLRREALVASRGSAAAAGVGLGEIRDGRRRRPDGGVLEWRLTDPYALPLDGAVPFLISWGDTPHPAVSAPRGGELVDLTVRHPRPGTVTRSLGALGVELAVEAGETMRLVATIRARSGAVVELS